MPQLYTRPRFVLLTIAFATVLLVFHLWHMREPVQNTPPPRLPVYIPHGRLNNTIVMASTKHDHTDWVIDELSKWQPMIYSVDNPRATLQTPANKGNEAMAYLTYIIDYYDRLPPISIFLHAHRDGYPRAWHTDAESYSNVVSVSRLRLESVQARGFVNLRCSVVPGCPAEIQLSEATGKHQAFATAWTELFGDAKIPSKIGSPCCAQFAVSDIAILRNSKEDYVKYRKWLLDTHLDSNTSGWVFEYLWHIIFGREPVMCQSSYSCRCEVYGINCYP